MVGGPGFEPGASRSRTVRAAGLRQPPPAHRILVRFHRPAAVTSAATDIKVALASATSTPSPTRSMRALA